MIDLQYWTSERAAGLVLVLGAMVVFPGLMMFWIRGGQRGGAPPSPAYYLWERRFVMAAALVSAVGFILLEGQLENGAGVILARVGATAFLVAGIFIAAAEALSPSLGYGKLYPLISISVVVAFLAQAAIGASLLQAGLLAGWIGWATILWNIAWLVVLPLITPRDIYFPVLHHVMPLLIGIALLWQTP